MSLLFPLGNLNTLITSSNAFASLSARLISLFLLSVAIFFIFFISLADFSYPFLSSVKLATISTRDAPIAPTRAAAEPPPGVGFEDDKSCKYLLIFCSFIILFEKFLFQYLLGFKSICLKSIFYGSYNRFQGNHTVNFRAFYFDIKLFGPFFNFPKNFIKIC